MKKYILSLVCSSIAVWASATVSRSYYANVDGKSGATLFSTLTTITNNGYHALGYDGLYTAYSQTDVYPADSVGRAGDIWDIYGDCEFSTGEKCGSYSHECDCYNREHSIPQSWWGGGTGNIGCDIFHVIPTDGKVNGIRSNYPYGEVSGTGNYNYNGNKRGTSVTSGVGTVFEPRDEYKGDLARGILGTIMKWNTTKTMTSSEGSRFFQNSYTASSNYGLTTYAVNLLLKWHRQDPVSRKEIDRNNGIQATQGNRNPFIDFPYLVEYIWGNCKGQTVELDSLIASFETSFVPGVSNGWGGSNVTPTNPGTDIDNPGTDIDNPGTDIDNPGTDIDNPGTDIDNPGTTNPTGIHHGCVDFSSMYSGTAVDPATEFELCGDSVVLTLINGTNPCKYYTDAIRVYAGGKLSFESVEPLKSITLSYGASDNSNQITADCGTWNDPTWTGNSTKVVLTVGGSSKHRRVAQVCVTYGEETDEPIVTTITQNKMARANVILKNGRIIIERNGTQYDLYGRNL